MAQDAVGPMDGCRGGFRLRGEIHWRILIYTTSTWPLPPGSSLFTPWFLIICDGYLLLFLEYAWHVALTDCIITPSQICSWYVSPILSTVFLVLSFVFALPCPLVVKITDVTRRSFTKTKLMAMSSCKVTNLILGCKHTVIQPGPTV